ncbi:Alpha/Beta hydrolase protein [Gaertneriomyces semiglobifer]|nr:Alpha/Beta hydrolase protein [Gaertneriomyces semiglobifer]
MPALRPIFALLACVAAWNVQAAPGIANLKSRQELTAQAQNAEAIRLQFLSDVIGGEATPDMVADLRASAISGVIAREAEKNNADVVTEVTPQVNADQAAFASNSTSSLEKRANYISGPVLDQLKLHQGYAAAAYCLAGIDNWTCRERCTGSTKGTIIVKKFDDLLTNTVGFIGYNPSQKSIVVSFRGTLSVRNLITDLKLYKVDAAFTTEHLKVPKGAQIHGGFRDSYRAAQSTVRETVKSLLEGPARGYTVNIVGHSMGGAIGIIAAIDLYDFLGTSMGDRIKVFTFGEPRVGNKMWADWVYTLPFSKNIFRVTHDDDVIPLIPPRFLGFQHHRAEHWLDGRGRLSQCDDSVSEAAACAATTIIPNIVHHLMGYFDYPFGPWC